MLLYADFIVNEVDTDGNVVHLTCFEPPPQVVEETKECEAKVSDEKMSERKSYEAEIELFRSLAGDSDAEKLKSFISLVNSGNGSEESVSHIVLFPDSDKAHRTAVHNFFKQNFKFLVTDTTDGPDASSKCIRVRLDSRGLKNNGRNSRKRKERGDKPFDSRGSSNWPEHIGKFLRFHLYKENKDTQEALGIIGKMLGVQTRSFGFAGTKDKRAVSTQRVSHFSVTKSAANVIMVVSYYQKSFAPTCTLLLTLDVTKMEFHAILILSTSSACVHVVLYSWALDNLPYFLSPCGEDVSEEKIFFCFQVTVFKQHASRLAALNDRLIGIKVGDFCHVKEGLLLGQLLGNRFTVTLRGVVADSEDTIKASADSLGRHGFINYFGLQRFGSGSVPTHFIGAALLRGEWKSAISMILDPREGDILSLFLCLEFGPLTPVAFFNGIQKNYLDEY
ncbi:unnamed protein product [Dovyalis caffra]|uniref:TRUD domain-containing protein n=1 Tax=Dovyalis caffra TaxID=77055 RepID=A0AAV1S014_9ROSI|nr:unnamed protein product [Dovyalis caffra]